eukprot:1450528-Pleurochrysis_carterae.AAC.1
MIIKFETIWDEESQPSPFKADEPTAVEFLSAVLASAVETPIKHPVALTEAVVVDSPIYCAPDGGYSNDLALI